MSLFYLGDFQVPIIEYCTQIAWTIMVLIMMYNKKFRTGQLSGLMMPLRAQCPYTFLLCHPYHVSLIPALPPLMATDGCCSSSHAEVTLSSRRKSTCLPCTSFFFFLKGTQSYPRNPQQISSTSVARNGLEAHPWTYHWQRKWGGKKRNREQNYLCWQGRQWKWYLSGQTFPLLKIAGFGKQSHSFWK